MQYTPVAKIEEIPEGSRKRFEIEGERITVFHIEGQYYAIRDTCPHKKTAPLLRGTLDGLGIQCPNHGYRFDLITGECNVGPQWNTQIFPVKIEDDQLLIGIESK